MDFQRHLSSLFVIGLLGQLAACATPPAASDVAPAMPATTSVAQDAAAPTVAPVLAIPPEPALVSAVQSASAAGAAVEPVVIRGNDRLVAATRAGSDTVLRGPASAFNFQDAPTAQVVEVMLRDLLKVDYVVHPPLPGTITLITRQAISADKAINLLESALQINGVVMARDSRGTYHVGTPEALRTIIAAPRQAGAGTLPPGYGAIIIPLEYLGANEMATILKPMVSADAIVRVDTVRNVLVMRGTRAEAEGWLDVVKTFDVNLLRGMSVGVFPLKYTSTAEVEAALRLLSGGSPTAPTAGGASTPGTPAPSTASTGAAGAGGQRGAAPAIGANTLGEGSPLFGAVRVMPIERINAMLVVSPRAAYLDEIRYWIEQFDRPNMNSVEPQLFVYKVQNGSADHLAELLNGIYGGTVATGGATGATGVAPGLGTVSGLTGGAAFGAAGAGGVNRGVFGASTSGAGLLGGGGGGGGFGGGLGGLGGGATGGAFGTNSLNRNMQTGQQQAVTSVILGQSVRVMADRINNTLLVHAKPAEYERIAATLKRLDQQRAQVLIEASIVEVTLGDGLQYGLQWAFNNGFGGGRGGTGVLNNNASSAVNIVPGATSLAAAAGLGFSYALNNAAGNITALLSALASKSLVKVISSPSLLVLDNHTASIAVGTQQPVNVGGAYITSTGVPTTGNIQYKDTGVQLNVTPSINAGDLVTLDINQNVSDIAPTVDGATGQYPFMQRQINSKVAVRSGETLALGGLIKDNAGNSRSGLPLLSSIPILGALFGSQQTTAGRTELLIVLTPRVIRSDEDARAISRELRDRMKGLTATGMPSALPAATGSVLPQ